MNRTTYERAGSSLSEFFASNRRLLVFLSLFLLGVFGGAMVFTVSHAGLTAELSLLLKVPAIEGGFQGGISVLFSSCFSTVVLLLLLFLAPVHLRRTVDCSGSGFFRSRRRLNRGVLLRNRAFRHPVCGDSGYPAQSAGRHRSHYGMFGIPADVATSQRTAFTKRTLWRPVAGFPVVLCAVPGLFWPGFRRGRARRLSADCLFILAVAG